MVAIGNTFDPQKAETSTSYAYKCWYNYNYEKNTLGITEAEIRELNQQWASQINAWKATVAKDETKYEITDDISGSAACWASGVNDSEEKSEVPVALKAAGVNDSEEKSEVPVALKAAGGVTTSKTAKHGGVAQAAKNTAPMLATSIGALVAAAPMTLSTGILYETLKPNKKEYEDLMDLKDELEGTVTDTMYENQDLLINAESTFVAETENAHKNQESVQEELEEKKKQYELCKPLYDGLMERVNSGEELSDSDMQKLTTCGEILQALGKEIEALNKEFLEAKSETIDVMEDGAVQFETRAEELSNSTDIASEAESFDTATRNWAVAQATAQAINVAEGLCVGTVLGAAAISPLTWWLAAFSAMGFAGAGMSTHGVIEQTKFAHNINEEIGIREDTQDLIAESSDIYENSLSTYDFSLNDVNEIELDIDEELLALKDFEIPAIPTFSDVEGETGESSATAVEQTSSMPESTTVQPMSDSAASTNPFANSESADTKKNFFVT